MDIKITKRILDAHQRRKTESFKKRLEWLTNRFCISKKKARKFLNEKAPHFLDFDYVEAISDELLKFVPDKKKAFSILEKEDYKDINEKVAIIRYLNHCDLPLYSLAELKDIIEKFLEFLGANKTSILTTGYPAHRFSASQWLDQHLSHLYPVYLPLTFDINCNSVITASNYYQLMRDKELNKIQDSDAKKLETIRELIYGLKCGILDIILSVINTNDSDLLHKGCLDLINSIFEPHPFTPLDFMNIDFTGFSQFIQGVELNHISQFFPGGLSDILYFIGSCEEELRYGICHKIRESFEPFVETNKMGGIKLKFESYFQVIMHPERKELDKAINLFKTRISQYPLFWDNYWKQIEKELLRPIGVQQVEQFERLKKHFDQRFSDLSDLIIDLFSKGKKIWKIKIPDDFEWDMATLTFSRDSSGEFIRVSIGNRTPKYRNVKQCGLTYGSKKRNTLSRWNLLKLFTRNNHINDKRKGQLFKDMFKEEKWDVIKEAMKEVKRALKELFSDFKKIPISFHGRRNTDGYYITAFNIAIDFKRDKKLNQFADDYCDIGTYPKLKKPN